MNTRDWAKDRLEKAAKHCDHIGTYIYVVAERYQELHPEVSTPLYNLLEVVAELQQNILKNSESF